MFFMALSLSWVAELKEIDKKWFDYIPILSTIILIKVVYKGSGYIWVFVGAVRASFFTNYMDYYTNTVYLRLANI